MANAARSISPTEQSNSRPPFGASQARGAAPDPASRTFAVAAGLIDDLIALDTVADDIALLAQLIETTVEEFRLLSREWNPCFAEMRPWREMATLSRMVEVQADIVRKRSVALFDAVDSRDGQ